MKYNKKAEMGMGTLIIFIAMIIVAAIAAAVLISTTTSLQNKALETGTATRDEVGTALNVLELYGVDGTTGSLDNLTAVVKLSAGSEPVRFSDLLISLSLDNASEDYTFENNSADLNSSEFVVQYSINGSEHKDEFLSTGDVAKITFISPRGITESEDVVVGIIPKTGTPSNIDTQAPSLILNQRTRIFP